APTTAPRARPSRRRDGSSTRPGLTAGPRFPLRRGRFLQAGRNAGQRRGTRGLPALRGGLPRPVHGRPEQARSRYPQVAPSPVGAEFPGVPSRSAKSLALTARPVYSRPMPMGPSPLFSILLAALALLLLAAAGTVLLRVRRSRRTAPPSPPPDDPGGGPSVGARPRRPPPGRPLPPPRPPGRRRDGAGVPRALPRRARRRGQRRPPRPGPGPRLPAPVHRRGGRRPQGGRVLHRPGRGRRHRHDPSLAGHRLHPRPPLHR